MIIHPFEPFYDKDSEILILGSFPSVGSREAGFYYGHKSNRFWMVLACIFGEGVPVTITQKKDFLKSHRIALWDVIESCEVENSADSSIRNVKVNDVNSVLKDSNIKKIITNGNLASKLYNTHLVKLTGIKAVNLPSTSAANASYSLERLCKKWAEAIDKT